MAIMALTATVGTSLTAPLGRVDIAAITAAVATLVADGATPTQAHVTALNAAYALLIAPDVVLLINSSANVASKNKLDEIMRNMRRIVEGSNLLTPLMN